MTNRLAEGIGKWTETWVDAAQRRATWVCAMAALATALCVYVTWRELSVRGDPSALLSERLPFRRLELQLEDAIPANTHNLVLVVDADSPEQAREATRALALHLREDPEHFRHVFALEGDPFFERNGLLYLDLDALEALADRLAGAQPFLSRFSSDPSLAGMAAALRRAIEQVQQGDLSIPELPSALESIASALEGALSGESSAFSWERWVLGAGAASRSRQLVLVQPALEADTLQPARKAMASVWRLARPLGFRPEGNPRLRITGDEALFTEEMEIVGRQAKVAGLVSFGLVGSLLWLAFRCARLVLASLVTLAAGLTWTAAFATLAIGELNVVSVAFAVLFIGLGIDFSIHFGVHYQEARSLGSTPSEALRQTGSTVGRSLVMCAGTTALGFYSFAPTSYAGVAQLGLISGTGMLLSLIATLTLLPALLSLFPPSQGTAPADATRSRLPGLAERHPRPVLMVAGLVGLAGATALPTLGFDANPLHVRDPSAPSVEAMRDLLADRDTSPWSAELLARGAEQARVLEQKLEPLPEVNRVVSLLDYVPAQQPEKLEVLADISLFLGDLQTVPVDPTPDLERAVPRLGELEEALVASEATLGSSPLGASAARLRQAVVRVRARIEAVADPSAEVRRIEEVVLGNLRRFLPRLDKALDARPITRDDLPPSLRERYESADGRLRVQVFPAEPLTEPVSLERFVTAVRTVAPEAAGPAVVIVESARAIETALGQAFAAAIVAIAIFLWITGRRGSDVVLVLLPLVLAAVVTLASTVVTWLSLNFANVIVLPLLLGIGVDTGIHLVNRHRSLAPGQRSLLHTSTARAVAFSGLTTMASFGTLGFSSHRGMASLGQLLTLGVLLTLLANLVALPALLSWLASRQRGPR